MTGSNNIPLQDQAGKVALAFTIARGACATLTRSLTSPFRGEKGHPVYFKDVAFAGLRAGLASMTLAQLRLIVKSTTKAYHNCARLKKLAPESIDLPNGVQAHWLGDKNAATTLLHFHGGGYAVPASQSCFEYLRSLIKEMSTAGAPVSALILAYTLAPEAEYPTQLIEAAALVQHLVEKENRAPSSLILSGDSAGGNLTLSLLSHILHPHSNPAVPRIILSEPFRAALLISPWVSFATDHSSYSRNAESDMFDAVALNRWATAFLGSNKREGTIMGDSYSEPLLAESSWWSGASKAVNDVMIWAGGAELFVDGIKLFAHKFEKGWVSGGGDRKSVKLVVTPRNSHEEMIVDILLGYKKKGDAALAVEAWAKSKL
ncbi:alpha/beta hydrolase fold domain-containing protein [Venturia nashicola]|uniref:Alpha/beta hydrolase fold domain-containing protein n=1 Tax=Venturia nashicola TaxID=86259 RepID=A0A4Z1PB98_9PEZI|nr:alpha/beta hydrolase fold domain-containing protein [Venturia nashicola]TLD29551.1 alpha/beta hydrolase fold domain-containing protein [Venturia nashicola]